MALFLFVIGNILIIIGYQIRVPDPLNIPEWIYDMLSIGKALFMTAPFFLVIGLCKKYVNWHLSFSRIPTALGSYFTLFNMGKEITGLNNDYSTTQLIVFLIGMAITLITQYECHRKHIGE